MSDRETRVLHTVPGVVEAISKAIHSLVRLLKISSAFDISKTYVGGESTVEVPMAKVDAVHDEVVSIRGGIEGGRHEVRGSVRCGSPPRRSACPT